MMSLALTLFFFSVTSFESLQQTGTGAKNDLPLLGAFRHTAWEKVYRRKMSSDHK
jgi:hypothetical protein